MTSVIGRSHFNACGVAKPHALNMLIPAANFVVTQTPACTHELSRLLCEKSKDIGEERNNVVNCS